MPGLRTYTERTRLPGGGFGKQIDAASMHTKFAHAKTPTLVLHGPDDDPSMYFPCPGMAAWPIFGAAVYHEWRLHLTYRYRDWLKTASIINYTKSQLNLDLVRMYADFAGYTYEWTVEAIRKDIGTYDGWRLMGYARVKGSASDIDQVLVMQSESTNDCVIAMEGSQSLEDLDLFAHSHGTGYCGFNNTHTGVRNELWTITADTEYKAYIKPALGKCASVTCVGHSLGGSLCEIFTACANSRRKNDPDYQLLAWTQDRTSKTELMDQV